MGEFVWILDCETHYDGTELVGVFSTSQRAMDYANGLYERQFLWITGVGSPNCIWAKINDHQGLNLIRVKVDDPEWSV